MVFGFPLTAAWLVLVLCLWSVFAMCSKLPSMLLTAVVVPFVGLMFASIGTIAVPGVNGWMAPHREKLKVGISVRTIPTVEL